ncbi:lytic transglycosylase domain-containing protein [Tropicibacter naphthalenivorans]|uniref:Soluble lytic murein transglycosylase n=1 Tax=Tropicibacter naphthalenivorans TaxID=441103 RepID=A0A0P1G140_9RHOB|nr:lytic transglycosylase domain-containing protein [Tropicibacter naphthalenivorans]CUH75498.1 Soluble lytic murein transglycosylase precursor [Tropicibacter naphthalenivorans]SMC44117.1 soluble lytic murein transglycosylase [Tropicibacter naphthalenivorans]
MSRVFALLVLLCSATVAVAQDAGAALGRAMADMRRGDWGGAQIEARIDGRAALDVILWHNLRAGLGDAREVQDFLARNPDWPGLPYLREKSEAAMSQASAEEIRAFFADVRPQTGTGALALARAYAEAGDDGAAQAEVVLAWRTLALSSSERRAFLDAWGDVLKEHHTARLDMALWKGWSQNAGAMVPLVDEGWQALAEARMALRNNAGGVDTLIAKVPEALQDHPGLAFERFLWRARKGRSADAIELLLAHSGSVEDLGAPWAWARERRDLARERMRDGAYAEAYQIAAQNWLYDGSDFADLEWLAGFIALRHLNDPARAVAHFDRFREAVWTPISVGRAGYWLGRAHEAAGNAEAAQEAYKMGAQFQTSFYGLLAAERGGIAPDPRLNGLEDFGDWRQAAFTKSSVFQAAILLLAAGETSLGERFLTHLAEGLDRQGMGLMGAMLADMQRPHVQVMLGKRAAQYGIELPGPYYAVPRRIAQTEFPVPKELVLAIARRESEFDPVVVSGAGARGYMQLMPGTAQEVARGLGLEYSRERLLSDPSYNARLGSTYLAELSERFGANAVMMAAGYNAGPSRPIRWMEAYGDPRKGEVDVIDWIETIPFDETRNYVMRVTESLPVYRARLGLEPHPVPFSQELIGATMPAIPVVTE